MTFLAPHTEADIQAEKERMVMYISLEGHDKDTARKKQEKLDRMIKLNEEQASLLNEFDKMIAGLGFFCLADLPVLSLGGGNGAQSVGTLLHVAVSQCVVSGGRQLDEAKAKHVIDSLIAAGVSASDADAHGNTPATIAALHGCTTMKRHLLRAEQRTRFESSTPAHILNAARKRVDGSPKPAGVRGMRRGHGWQVRIEVRSASLAAELTDAERMNVYSIDSEYMSSRRCPIGELLDTYAGECFGRATLSGRPVGHGRLDFRLDGKRLDGTEQISTLNLSALGSTLDETSVIEVFDLDEGLEDRTAALRALNALAARADVLALRPLEQAPAAESPAAIAGTAAGACTFEIISPQSLDGDSLDALLHHLEPTSLHALALTSRAWLWACLRHCLLRQLHSGELRLRQWLPSAEGGTDGGGDVRTYAEWIRLLERSEFALALASCTPALRAGSGAPGAAPLCDKSEAITGDAMFRKFEPLTRLYPSSGGVYERSHMRIMRRHGLLTLAARGIDGPALRAEATRCRAESGAWLTERAARAAERPPAKAGTITEALVDEEVGGALRLFSRYFARALEDVMPLVVSSQAALGFDFSSTRTWVVYAEQMEQMAPTAALPLPRQLKTKAPVVAGAVAWRLHEPPTGSPLPPTLEVLFLAVDPTARNCECGRALVRALGQHAAAACGGLGAVLYVEVARHEKTPQAFWTRHGLCDASAMGAGAVSQELRAFWDARCWRFSDTLQYVRMPDAMAGEGEGDDALVEKLFGADGEGA